MEVTVELGGYVILMEEPQNAEHQITHYIRDELEEQLWNGLSTITGATLKALDGPLINGLWVATFEFPTIAANDLVAACKRIFIQHLRPNTAVEKV